MWTRGELSCAAAFCSHPSARLAQGGMPVAGFSGCRLGPPLIDANPFPEVLAPTGRRRRCGATPTPPEQSCTSAWHPGRPRPDYVTEANSSAVVFTLPRRNRQRLRRAT